MRSNSTESMIKSEATNVCTVKCLLNYLTQKSFQGFEYTILIQNNLLISNSH